VQKLKPVEQLDQCGCTIACLAMILEMPYFQVRTELHSTIDRLKKPCVPYTEIGLNCVDMQVILEREFSKPCQFIKFLSLSKLKKHCMLYICPLEGGYSGIHAVMFDAISRKLIDPTAHKIINLDNFNVMCCIEIADFDPIE